MGWLSNVRKCSAQRRHWKEMYERELREHQRTKRKLKAIMEYCGKALKP